MEQLQFYSALFNDSGMEMTTSLADYLQQKEEKKVLKRKYRQKVDVKIRRLKQQKKLWQDIYIYIYIRNVQIQAMGRK
jgi:hypothetical protein